MSIPREIAAAYATGMLGGVAFLAAVQAPIALFGIIVAFTSAAGGAVIWGAVRDDVDER